MYAGAAREAVFSVPEVIHKVNADYIPLALRATSVNTPDSVPDPDERWLYQRIHRAKIAPQGICILNAAGQVLVWVQTFDDNQSVLAFLDHGRKRSDEQADPRQLVTTERYMRYPGHKMAEVRDETKLPLKVAGGHGQGQACSADKGKGKTLPGSLRARLVGRVLDDKGKPLPDIINQEHYVEDQLSVPPQVQEAVRLALLNADGQRIRLPEEFSKLCASHAYLGHLDVQPCMCMVKGKAENKGEWKKCEFWVHRVTPAGGKPEQEGIVSWRIAGESEVVSDVGINGRGVHNVKLTWEGFLVMKGDRMTQLLLSGTGREQLEFNKNARPLKGKGVPEVAVLPGGRPIDVDADVRYGIIGELPAQEEVKEVVRPADKPAQPAQVIPEEARRQLIQGLGGSFLIYRDKVLQELKVSDQQKRKLLDRLPEIVQDTMHNFQKVQDLPPDKRDKEIQAYRGKAQKHLALFLKETLNDGQLQRLRQLELQQEGVFAIMHRSDVSEQLQVTEKQAKQFISVMQDLQSKIRPLIREAQTGGNPQEIFPMVMKVRRDHERRIEDLLTESQRKQWRQMQGAHLDHSD